MATPRKVLLRQAEREYFNFEPMPVTVIAQRAARYNTLKHHVDRADNALTERIREVNESDAWDSSDYDRGYDAARYNWATHTDHAPSLDYRKGFADGMRDVTAEIKAAEVNRGAW